MRQHVRIYKSKGRGLLFISVSQAVEGLICRYINSSHASFIMQKPSSPGIDGYQKQNKHEKGKFTQKNMYAGSLYGAGGYRVDHGGQRAGNHYYY